MAPSKTVAAMLCVAMVSTLLLTQDVAAGRAAGTIHFNGGGVPVHCCAPGEAGKAGASKDDTGISIGGGHVTIGGSVHVGGNGKPKHGGKSGTPRYGKP